MTDTIDLDLELNGFLDGLKLPGELIFGKVWGSHSHDTALPDSDIDYLTVYGAPTQDILSIDGVPEGLDNQTDKDYDGPDFQANELRKFCRLLLKGNPGIIEMLFTDRYCRSTCAWGDLRRFRNDFLTHVTVEQYLGYAKGQLGRIKKGTKLHTTGGEYNTKWAYHLMRLLGDALDIVRGAPPEVWKENGEQKLLMLVRSGGLSQDDVIHMAGQRMQCIEDSRPWKIPEQMPKEKLNNWLLEYRKSHL